MRVLADTHSLVWAAADPDRLAPAARDLLADPHADVWFSVVSIWEVVIKAGRRPDFGVDGDDLRPELEDDYVLVGSADPASRAAALDRARAFASIAPED